MDYLFVFLISTGFVSGVFKGLRKSIKSFLCLIITFAIFFLIFIEIKNFVIAQGFFKKEFVLFFQERMKGVDFLARQYSSVDEMLLGLEKSHIPKFLIVFLKRFCDFPVFTIGDLVANAVYEIIVGLVVAVLLFVVCSCIIKFFLFYVFSFFKQDNDLFVTKRFLSGCVGALRGAVVFVICEFVILLIVNMFDLEFLRGVVSNSKVASITEGVLSGFVMSFLSG